MASPFLKKDCGYENNKVNEWMHILKFTCVHLNVFNLTVVSSLLLKIIMETSLFYCLILLKYIQQVSHFFQTGFKCRTELILCL